jgi:hypothetical protein
MKIKELLFKDSNKSIIYDAIYYLWIILSFQIFVLTRIKDYIAENSEYEVTSLALSRLTLFAVVVSLIGLKQIAGIINIRSSLAEFSNRNSLILAALFSITLFNGYLLAINKLTEGGAYLTILLVLGHFFLGILFNYKNIVVKNNSYLGGVLVALSLFLPLSGPKYLNFESDIDLVLVNELANSVSKKFEKLPSYFDIPLERDEMSVVEGNIAKIKLRNQLLEQRSPAIGYYNINKSEGINYFRLYTDVANVRTLCLLGNYKIQVANEEKLNINQCYDLLSNPLRNREWLLTAIERINFVSLPVEIKIATNFKEVYLLNEVAPQRISTAAEELISLMTVKGGYYHHYNAAAHTVNNATSIIDLAVNQYGLGPLLIVKLISYITNYSTFDSIFISVILINFILFFVIYVNNLSLKSDSKIIWIGFSMSILVTYSMSYMMAPFLYYIRYLPTIFICILLHRAVLKNIVIATERNYKITLFLCCSLTAFYNFEYAILTFSGFILAGLILRESFYVICGGLFSLISIIPKLLVNASSINGPNYLGYLAGVGMGIPPITLVASLFFAIIVLLLFIFNRFSKRNKPAHELVVLLSILIFLCVKIIWIMSSNHIGALFLVSALFFDALIIFYSRNGIRLDNYLFMPYFIFLIIVGVICTGTYLRATNGYTRNFAQLEYVQSSISSIFRIPSRFNSKIENFKLIYKDGDLLLSLMDNTLSLAVNNVVTEPFYDISSNNNSQQDLLLISNAYLSSNNRRIIIDRALLPDESEFPYTWTLLSPRSAQALAMHQLNLDKMANIYHILISNGLLPCDENSDFIVICFPGTQ